MPVTATELAGYLQRDLDQYSAEQALAGAVAAFEAAAGIKLSPTTATYETVADGRCRIWLPDYPVTAVSAVTVAGAAVTDYARIGQVLYRSDGFGDRYTNPPAALVVTYTHGLADVPADVKTAILDTAAAAYTNPDQMRTENVGSTGGTYTGVGFSLSLSARALAALYRRAAVA